MMSSPQLRKGETSSHPGALVELVTDDAVHIPDLFDDDYSSKSVI